MEMTRIEGAAGGDEHRDARTMEIIRDRLGSAIRLVDQLTAPVPFPASSNPVTEQKVRAILKMRRLRDRHFDPELFADPAWDMLLELYATYLGQQRISVSSLCDSAAAPATTALRWIATLEDRCLIEKHQDPLDRRRYFVSLTADGREAMENYFQTPGIAI